MNPYQSKITESTRINSSNPVSLKLVACLGVLYSALSPLFLYVNYGSVAGLFEISYFTYESTLDFIPSNILAIFILYYFFWIFPALVAFTGLRYFKGGAPISLFYKYQYVLSALITTIFWQAFILEDISSADSKISYLILMESKFFIGVLLSFIAIHFIQRNLVKNHA